MISIQLETLLIVATVSVVIVWLLEGLFQG